MSPDRNSESPAYVLSPSIRIWPLLIKFLFVSHYTFDPTGYGESFPNDSSMV